MGRNAVEGTYNGEPTYCPLNCRNEKDCPYAKDGICHMENPIIGCDEFGYFFCDWTDWEEA